MPADFAAVAVAHMQTYPGTGRTRLAHKTFDAGSDGRRDLQTFQKIARVIERDDAVIDAGAKDNGWCRHVLPTPN